MGNKLSCSLENFVLPILIIGFAYQLASILQCKDQNPQGSSQGAGKKCFPCNMLN